VVFENRFPSLRANPPAHAIEGAELYPALPGQGVCEVIVYTPHHSSTLAAEPVEQIYKLARRREGRRVAFARSAGRLERKRALIEASALRLAFRQQFGNGEPRLFATARR